MPRLRHPVRKGKFPSRHEEDNYHEFQDFVEEDEAFDLRSAQRPKGDRVKYVESADDDLTDSFEFEYERHSSPELGLPSLTARTAASSLDSTQIQTHYHGPYHHTPGRSLNLSSYGSLICGVTDCNGHQCGWVPEILEVSRLRDHIRKRHHIVVESASSSTRDDRINGNLHLLRYY